MDSLLKPLSVMQPLHLALSSVTVALAILALLARRANSKLPPGPPGLPILGNVLQVPTGVRRELTHVERQLTFRNVASCNLLPRAA